MQIKNEKKGNNEAVEKKANKLLLKVDEANDAVQVYKSDDKMTKELYYDIVKFLVPFQLSPKSMM